MPPISATSPIVNLVAGGSIGGDISIYNSSFLNVSGDVTGAIHPFDNSVVNINDGTLGNFLYAGTGSSNVHISGGNLNGGVYVGENTSLDISGGNVGILTH